MIGPRADARVQAIIDNEIKNINDYNNLTLLREIFDMCQVEQFLPQIVLSQAACDEFINCSPLKWMYDNE